jgi:hypothetical protein
MTNNKVKSQKLSFQYFYLCLDLEETTELCEQANENMRKFLKEVYPDYYNDFYNPKPKVFEADPEESPEQEKIEEDNVDPIEKESSEEEPELTQNLEEVERSIPKNKDLKKLYRKIAEKTHPDKVGSDKYSSIFSAAADAYANNNLAEILKICGNMNIEIVQLCPESIALLKDNIKEISESIYHKKQTAAWQWTETQNEQQKRELIERILQYRGII